MDSHLRLADNLINRSREAFLADMNDPTEEEVAGSITRRQALRRGTALGGAVLWATPVVQILGMSPALAQGISPNPPDDDDTPGDDTPGGDDDDDDDDDTPGGDDDDDDDDDTPGGDDDDDDDDDTPGSGDDDDDDDDD